MRMKNLEFEIMNLQRLLYIPELYVFSYQKVLQIVWRAADLAKVRVTKGRSSSNNQITDREEGDEEENEGRSKGGMVCAQLDPLAPQI